MTKNLKHVSISLLLLGMASSVFALNEKQIRTEIQKRLGTSANVRNVTPSPIPGLFEVQVNNEIFYTDSNAKYLIQGEMVELASGNNLTTKRQEDINRIKWSELPQAQAFKVVRGNGSRQIAVFSDPNCGYCKRLEKTLQQLDNVTIYNYLIPILSADSALKSKQIWCAADQQKVWNDWMLNNLGPSGKSDCANPIDKNLTLAKNYGINGTPTIFFTDGSRFPGAVQLADIEKKLASLK
ncbi:MAG: DsbC family protein [Burkholderiaceae bacterium]|jgi:thiol:disulfide interchange protein DsbC|uniref:Thiol:disulfide interchange protein n=1 Tax=Polynucleobacter sp. UK-FUSCHL-C3 TaxID=2955208 RepID=A0AAU8A3R5_9BURK|nr:DsbC family protein [Burkholderiaceae bacterium]